MLCHISASRSVRLLAGVASAFAPECSDHNCCRAADCNTRCTEHTCTSCEGSAALFRVIYTVNALRCTHCVVLYALHYAR
jgi:hypothetical protein